MSRGEELLQADVSHAFVPNGSGEGKTGAGDRGARALRKLRGNAAAQGRKLAAHFAEHQRGADKQGPRGARSAGLMLRT